MLMPLITASHHSDSIKQLCPFFFFCFWFNLGSRTHTHTHFLKYSAISWLLHSSFSTNYFLSLPYFLPLKWYHNISEIVHVSPILTFLLCSLCKINKVIVYNLGIFLNFEPFSSVLSHPDHYMYSSLGRWKWPSNLFLKSYSQL